MSLKHQWQAWQHLLKRYSDIWQHFWQQREQLSLPDFKADEAEFLPASLSIQAQPVSPAGRWVARILMLMMGALLVWSIWGEMDIVVNAQGKIIAGGYTKTIASIEVASVRTLAVTEGQFVKAGDVLMELDTRSVDSEREKFEGDQRTAWLQAQRVRALLLAIETGRAPVLHENAAASFPGLLASKQWHDAQMHLQDQWQDYQAKRQRIESEVQRLTRTLPLARQRAADYAELAKSHDVSQHAWLEKEQARIEMEGQLRDAKHQLASLISETRKSAQEALNDATRLVASTQKEAQRAAVHGELLRLTSPVDGTVQQLVVHTVGGVVPAAQPLMQIVPKNAPVEMEAFIENKDVGFVQTGQEAQVKVDTFEYTKYGTIAARVSHVSQDAIQDEKRGLIYAVKVSLLEPTMNIDGRQVVLSPGMSGSVEIKTGSRRVIEYVLSPLLQHTRESLRER